MRFFLVLLAALASGIATVTPVAAPRSDPTISAETSDIGQVEAHIERDDQSIAVVSRLVRPLGAETECYGICYAPSSTRTAVWRCGPNEACRLYCASNPPVGGCR